MIVSWESLFLVHIYTSMPTNKQRVRLYQVALELFYIKGFKATTMRDIASAMNFEAASLYNYIKSKDSLLEELLFDVADQFLDGIKLIRKSDQSNLEQLSDVIHLYIHITVSNPYKAALLTTEWRNLKEPVLSKFEAHRSEYEQHLKEILSSYFSDIQRGNMDIDIALHTFLGANRWIYEWYIKQNGAIDINLLEDRLKELILNGFANNKT